MFAIVMDKPNPVIPSQNLPNSPQNSQTKPEEVAKDVAIRPTASDEINFGSTPTAAATQTEKIYIPPTTHPVVISPPVETSVEPNSGEKNVQTKSDGVGKTALMLVSIVLAFLLLGTTVFLVAVAYGNISLGNNDLENNIKGIVMSVPFMPKTPDFILAKALDAHKTVSKHSFEFSTSVDSKDLKDVLSDTRSEILIKGGVDYSEISNPRFSINASVSNEFGIDARKNDRTLYFKVNKLPPKLLETYGVTDMAKLNEVLSNWVGFDTGVIDPLNGEGQATSITNESASKVINSLVDKSILQKIRVTSDKEGGVDVHRLNLAASDEMVDQFFLNARSSSTNSQTNPKFSEILKDVNIDIWVGKRDYYIRKMSLTTTVHPPKDIVTGLGSSPLTDNYDPFPMSAVLKMSDFGTPVSVEIPSAFITPDKYFLMLAQTSSLYQSLNNSSIDTNKKSGMLSVQNALEIYFIEKSKYPKSLDELVPTFLGKVPVDENGGVYIEYKTTNADKKYTLKTKLSTGEDFDLSSL